MRHATRNHGGSASNFERRKSHSRNDATLRYSAAGGFHPIVLNLFRLFVSLPQEFSGIYVPPLSPFSATRGYFKVNEII